MIDFEDQLRQALARQPAPEGFAKKTLARARAKQSQFWRKGAALGLVASFFLATFTWVEWDRRAQQKRAHDQLVLALKITSGQFQKVGKRLEGLN